MACPRNSGPASLSRNPRAPALSAESAFRERGVIVRAGQHCAQLALEAIGAPEVYGDDRLFVYVRLNPAPDANQDAAVKRLEDAGQLNRNHSPKCLQYSQESPLIFRKFYHIFFHSLFLHHPWNIANRTALFQVILY